MIFISLDSFYRNKLNTLMEIRPSDISDKKYEILDDKIKEYCRQLVIDNIKFYHQKQIKRFDKN